MRTSYLAAGVGAFLATAIAADFYFRPDTTVIRPPAGPIPLECDRVCLEAIVDVYLEALAENEPEGLPFSEDVRFSENNQLLDVGDGFWRTATGRGRYAHYISDPVTGQAAFVGTMKEGDTPMLLSLRLRIELGRITEIESATFRQAGGDPSALVAFDAAGGVDGSWLEEVLTEERLSRQEMTAVANTYFEVFEEGSVDFEPFAADCARIENGIRSLSCTAAFGGRDAREVTRVHQRRFPLIDEQRGVVWASSTFDRDGTVAGSSSRPSSLQMSGAFLIRHGRIERMELLAVPAPYHANSPWQGGLSGQ